MSAPLGEMRALCAPKLLASTYRELRTRYEVRRSNSANQAQRAKYSVRRIMLSASSAQICWSSPLAAQLGTAYSRGTRSGAAVFALAGKGDRMARRVLWPGRSSVAGADLEPISKPSTVRRSDLPACSSSRAVDDLAAIRSQAVSRQELSILAGEEQNDRRDVPLASGFTVT